MTASVRLRNAVALVPPGSRCRSVRAGGSRRGRTPRSSSAPGGPCSAGAGRAAARGPPRSRPDIRVRIIAGATRPRGQRQRLVRSHTAGSPRLGHHRKVRAGPARSVRREVGLEGGAGAIDADERPVRRVGLEPSAIDGQRRRRRRGLGRLGRLGRLESRSSESSCMTPYTPTPTSTATIAAAMPNRVVLRRRRRSRPPLISRSTSGAGAFCISASRSSAARSFSSRFMTPPPLPRCPTRPMPFAAPRSPPMTGTSRCRWRSRGPRRSAPRSGPRSSAAR